MLPDPRIEPVTVRMPGGRAFDQATGSEALCLRLLSCLLSVEACGQNNQFHTASECGNQDLHSY